MKAHAVYKSSGIVSAICAMMILFIAFDLAFRRRDRECYAQSDCEREFGPCATSLFIQVLRHEFHAVPIVVCGFVNTIFCLLMLNYKKNFELELNLNLGRLTGLVKLVRPVRSSKKVVRFDLPGPALKI